jgi:bifunctional non-homologous end joining protein LigD
MALNQYRKKRDFKISPEPSGEKSPARAPKSSLVYVVQKHRASHLHYDFRLEFQGTLLSWAIPKGPSLDPSVKRLAMHVEDHPVEYASFEGVIPEGEYGGGTVMVWDKGTWSPESPDVAAALEKGDLKFILHGKKLKGSWVLVRTRGFGSSTKTSWLLIKHRDNFASEVDIAGEMPRSALSNRLLSEIAQAGGGDVEKAATGDPEPEASRATPKTREKSRPATVKPARKSTATKTAGGPRRKRRKAST